jgi:hypothetical protein
MKRLIVLAVLLAIGGMMPAAEPVPTLSQQLAAGRTGSSRHHQGVDLRQ